MLLGHTNGDITTHYSVAELAELASAVKRIDRSDPGDHAASGYC